MNESKEIRAIKDRIYMIPLDSEDISILINALNWLEDSPQNEDYDSKKIDSLYNKLGAASEQQDRDIQRQHLKEMIEFMEVKGKYSISLMLAKESLD